MEKMISDYGLSQHIKLPTRVTNSSETIIDHLYSNTNENICEIIVPKLGLSDHYPIGFTRRAKNKSEKSDEHKCIAYRSFKTFCEDRFIEDLSKINFEAVETIDNPNSALDYFYEIVCTLFSKHAPVKQKRFKRLCQPGWLSSEIKQTMILRDKIKAQKNMSMYKVIRNKCIAVINKKQ